MDYLNFSDRVAGFRGSYNIYSMGDQHVGNLAVAYNALDEGVEIVRKDRRGVWCSGGDQVESIHVKDPRFSLDVHGDHAILNSQIDLFEEIYAPIKKKGLYLGMGNHEFKVSDVFNPVDEMAKRLGIKASGWSTVADFGSFKMFDTHGSRGITSRNPDPESRLALYRKSLRTLLMNMRSDCSVMLMHHIHQQFTSHPLAELCLQGKGSGKATYPTQYVGENGEIHPNSRLYGVAGSFLRTLVEGVTTYSERAGYNPTRIGMLKVVVRKGVPVEIEEIYLG